jgi:LPPG:FO 2-phospho-L-lactate transferase
MYTELGIQPSSQAVAFHYGKILSGFVLDKADANLAPKIPIFTSVTNILMRDQNDRQSLAQDVLNLIETLRSTIL